MLAHRTGIARHDMIWYKQVKALKQADPSGQFVFPRN
jgi:hypothetical protein